MMNAINESTLHFVEKTGDKILVELEITGNPDEAIKRLFMLMSKDIDVFDGAKIVQLFFKGRTIDSVINNAKEKFVKELRVAIDEIEKELIT